MIRFFQLSCQSLSLRLMVHLPKMPHVATFDLQLIIKESSNMESVIYKNVLLLIFLILFVCEFENVTFIQLNFVIFESGSEDQSYCYLHVSTEFLYSVLYHPDNVLTVLCSLSTDCLHAVYTIVYSDHQRNYIVTGLGAKHSRSPYDVVRNL